MKTKNIELSYIPEYNAFGIFDKNLAELEKKDITPIITLKNDDYKQLKVEPPHTDAPTIAFLMGREKDAYTINWNYAKAIAQSNVKIRFLTYKNNISQIESVDGLLLPGGLFSLPNEFYTDPLKKTNNIPGTRAYAYVTSIMEAEKIKLPILGICAGAQIIGSLHGLKMYRNIKEYTGTFLEHQTQNLNAHKIIIVPDSPLFELIGQKEIITNSRHHEAMMNNDYISDLNIYATSGDGIPEAWGNETKGIMCIQWHPEDFAAQGNQTMQKIYNWLARKARIYQKQKQLKTQKKITWIKRPQYEYH